MNNKGTIAILGRLSTIATLTAGMILGGFGPAQADRDRSENRYEERHEGRDDGRRQDRGREHVEKRQDNRVTVIRDLPRDHRKVRVGHVDYYVDRDHYYRKSGGLFVSVAPPLGAVVATLPLGHGRLTLGGALYFTFGNVYYRQVASGYQVVQAPVVGPSPNTVTVQVGLLNVRSGPGADFPVIDRVGRGELLILTGDAPGWYYVQLPNGAFGWVMSSFTGPGAAG